MSATDLVQGLESKVQGLESQLLDQKNENSEHKLKIEKLEKIQMGQKKGSGRSSGGYDANVDRISDLEEELEHLKTQMKKINVDTVEDNRLKLEELNYYKEQSEEYLKKLQEVRTLHSYDYLFIHSFLLFIFFLYYSFFISGQELIFAFFVFVSIFFSLVSFFFLFSTIIFIVMFRFNFQFFLLFFLFYFVLLGC